MSTKAIVAEQLSACTYYSHMGPAILAEQKYRTRMTSLGEKEGKRNARVE
jgi:hypothetical protein